MNNYNPGDAVMGVRPPGRKDFNGCDGQRFIVVEFRDWHEFGHNPNGPAYIVTSDGFKRFAAKPEWLRPYVPNGWVGIPGLCHSIGHDPA